MRSLFIGHFFSFEEKEIQRSRFEIKDVTEESRRIDRFIYVDFKRTIVYPTDMYSHRGRFRHTSIERLLLFKLDERDIFIDLVQSDLFDIEEIYRGKFLSLDC